METENRRVSSHGRGLPGGRPRVAHYFPDTEGMREDEVARIKLGRLRDLAEELGYNSLFDVALAEARHSPKEKQRFLEEGGLEEFFYSFRSQRRRKDEQINGQDRKIDEDICDMSRRIYMREWKRLLGDNKLKNAVMNGDSADDFSQPYFSELYAQMDSLAPQLFALINSLVPDISKRSEKYAIDKAIENDKENADLEIIDLTVDEDATPQSKVEKRQRKENRIVVALSVLTYATTTGNSVFQRWISKLLHTYQTPKKMLLLLHELGICMSYGVLFPARPKTGIATLQETQQTSPASPSVTAANQEETQQNIFPESMIPKPQLGTSGTAITPITEKMLPVTKTRMPAKSFAQFLRELRMAETHDSENARIDTKANSQHSSSQTHPASAIPAPDTTTSQSFFRTSAAPLQTDGQDHPPKRIRVSDPMAAVRVPRKPLVTPSYVKDFDLSTLQKSELNTFPYGQRRQS
jgi:hypothetical protein